MDKNKLRTKETILGHPWIYEEGVTLIHPDESPEALVKHKNREEGNCRDPPEIIFSKAELRREVIRACMFSVCFSFLC